MIEWIEEHPWTRPFAWWRFDMPEPRRVVRGVEHPESGYHGWLLEEPARSLVMETARESSDPASAWENAGVRRNYYFGEPSGFRWFTPEQCEQRGINHKDDRPIYESQFDYLERLGLFTEREHELHELLDAEEVADVIEGRKIIVVDQDD